MNARISYAKADPKALQMLLAVEAHLRNSKLEAKLLRLVKMRASQINRCAFCLEIGRASCRERVYGLV